MADPSSSSSRSASVIRSLQGKLRQLAADLRDFSPRPEALLPGSTLAIRENEVQEAAGFLEQDGLGPSAKRLLGHWEKFLVRATDVLAKSVDDPAYKPSEDELEALVGTVAGFESFLTELARETEPAEDDQAVCLVTLQQAAAMVNRSKRSLERLKPKMPPPSVQGGGGRPDEWAWSELRPWLEKEFERPLPERFPADRFRPPVG